MKWILTSLIFLCTPLIGADVLVSVLPQKSIVEAISGERLSVGVVVPPGADPHMFEPKARHAIEMQNANIWFRIGEGFEQRLLSAISFETIDLRDESDPHIWLSARELQKQARKITDALSRHYPQWQEEFETRCAVLISRLQATDEDIARLLADEHVLCVSHPAYGYFCRDYGLKQFSIEHHGKEPSPRQLVKLIESAKNAGVRRIFVQPQFSSRGAYSVANALGVEVVTVDPFKEDVITNLYSIAEIIKR